MARSSDPFLVSRPSASTLPPPSSRLTETETSRTESRQSSYRSVSPSSSSVASFQTEAASARSVNASRRRTRSRSVSSLWGSDPHNVVCAVSEARGVSPSVGLAFVNLSTSEATLSQICDSQFYVKTVHKIQMYEPSYILVIGTSFNPKSNLLSILEEELAGTHIHPVDRKYWAESAGLQLVQTLGFREDVEATKVAMQGNFFATCAFAAAISFIQDSCSLSISSHSLRISYKPSEDTMMIDISTIHSLELIQNIRDAKSKDCLFGLLNETLTPMGSRMLRSNILQPSAQFENTLEPRYDALDDLTTNEEMFFKVRKALKGFGDVEKLLTKLVIIPQQGNIQAAEQAINDVLAIKSFIGAVAPLHEALADARASLLTRAREACRPQLTQPVLDLVRATINDDVTFAKAPVDQRHNRTYAVKAGVKGLLDVVRQTYKDLTGDVHELVKTLNDELNVAADLKFDQRRNYWLRLRISEFEDRAMPEWIINAVTKGGWVQFQTMQLIQLNNRLQDSHNEAVMMSDQIIQDLLGDIRKYVPNMFRVCESIALVDMVASFGQSATTRDYVRPEITEKLALKSARHPVCERVHPDRFVPNDVFADRQHRFQMITGCNMSGKSTYIRMVSLLQVMAQIGCFVPAEYAAFPLVDQLFVRMSTDDSIEANMSTFSLEMREAAFILRNINERSLAIIDELGRGTSTRDGLAIALAISEALIQSNAMVWFVTHFHQLADIMQSRPGVLNLHLTAQLSERDTDVPTMKMLYKIESGPVVEQRYGINLARAIGLPRDFIDTARTVSDTLEAHLERKKATSASGTLLRRRKLIMSLHDTLKTLQSSDMDDGAIGGLLVKLQAEFIFRMDKLENGE